MTTLPVYTGEMEALLRELRIAKRNEAKWQAKCARQSAVIREMHERLSVTRLANIQLRRTIRENQEAQG